MALPPSKTPPRFVPTLTEVVQVPASTPLRPAASAPSRPVGAFPASGVPSTPAATPAAQTVARPLAAPPVPGARPPSVAVPQAATAAPVAFAAAKGAAAPTLPVASVPQRGAETVAKSVRPRPLPDGMEEYMVHRVMQRVDVVLDQRLREAIATVVQEQTRSVLPRLREEIESVVRHAVYEAVADELASGTPSVPRG